VVIDIHRVQQFTEDVGLLLAAGGVADPYGLRLTIAGKTKKNYRHPLRSVVPPTKSAVVLAMSFAGHVVALRCPSLERESEYAECGGSCQCSGSFVLRKPRRRGLFMRLLPKHAADAEVTRHGFE
jgi:hypothetical protein